MSGDLLAELREIAAAPVGSWRSLVHQRYAGDAELIRQALLWLAAERAGADDDATPQAEIDPRYELVARLDTGATATVWQARDRTLQRTVAIKLFHDRGSNAVSSVIGEARAACDVISDHVVRVLDAHHGERSYIVMEMVGEHDATGALVPGLPASDTRPRSVREAARWVMQIARGVHDAHLRGVFHRDLNPRNVLITPISRRARIADFGLAARERTGAACMRGTPGYLAPEQARGGARDPVAMDVWGLGAIAYDLLAGHAPWVG
ncbi:MAG: serine/threonine protein kinase, partial [Deltaproteobacteria bacterium]|nr:serine/threonine protein kinase [Deltaproteobacteria bacterium]